jgi:hypothetical protein
MAAISALRTGAYRAGPMPGRVLSLRTRQEDRTSAGPQAILEPADDEHRQ